MESKALGQKEIAHLEILFAETFEHDPSSMGVCEEIVTDDCCICQALRTWLDSAHARRLRERCS